MANTLISNVNSEIAHQWYWHNNPNGPHYATCVRCGIRKDGNGIDPPCHNNEVIYVSGRQNPHVLDSFSRAIFYQETIGDRPWSLIPAHEEKHLLDINYPHVCFRCKKPIYWRELFLANRERTKGGRMLEFNMPLYRKLKKLWKSQIVEFYCCECFNIKDKDPISFP